MILSLGCNLWFVTKYTNLLDLNESGSEHEFLLEMGLTDLAYYIKNSSLTPAQILDLAKKQPIKKGTERMQPELSENKFYRFPVEIIFSESGGILSVKIANESY